MRRRDVLAASAAVTAVSLGGCAKRVTGWSSLGFRFVNSLEQSVTLRVTVAVNDARAFERTVDLPADAREEVTASIDVPWDATLRFRATRENGDAEATEQWPASVPVWGGNKCTIEPVIWVDSEGIQIDQQCM